MPGPLPVLCPGRPRILFWSPTRVQRSGKSPHTIGQPRTQIIALRSPSQNIQFSLPILQFFERKVRFLGCRRPWKRSPSKQVCAKVTIAILILEKSGDKSVFGGAVNRYFKRRHKTIYWDIQMAKSRNSRFDSWEDEAELTVEVSKPRR
jgi:hypothetical protein